MPGLIIGVAGLYLSYLVARRSFSAGPSLLATVTVAVSFVIWSLFREPGMLHPLSAAASAFACWSWMRSRPTDSRRAVWLAAGAAAVIVVVALRLYAGLGHVGPPRIADLLWSSRSGLFATSPALYLAALGWLPLWQRDRAIATLAAAVFAAVCLTSAPPSGADTTAGLAGRPFGILIPFFVLGLAATLDWIARAAARRPALAATALLSALVVWNVTLMAVTRAGGHRIGEPVSFGDLAAQQAATVHDWIGHPASWPANLVYAVRHRIAPGRYDVLAPRAFFADPSARDAAIDVGANDDVYLEDGWHAAERSGAVTFRWASREAQLILPLDRAEPLQVRVTIQAFTYENAPPQSLALTVNGHALPARPVGPEWRQIEWPVPREFWRAGVNRLGLRFARETRPSETGTSTDSRALAAAIDTIRFSLSR